MRIDMGGDEKSYTVWNESSHTIKSNLCEMQQEYRVEMNEFKWVKVQNPSEFTLITVSPSTFSLSI